VNKINYVFLGNNKANTLIKKIMGAGRLSQVVEHLGATLRKENKQ
jgi:hypothetical protein